jgi:hypothetical protein
MPLGVVAAVILIYGVHHEAHGWVLAGLALVLVWGAIEIALGLKLLQRLRDAKAARKPT